VVEATPEILGLREDGEALALINIAFGFIKKENTIALGFAEFALPLNLAN
jgi:hypothetical protein